MCIAIDFRGHGSSTSIADISVLIDRPWLLRQDFDATLDYLESRDLELSDEIVVFASYSVN